MPPFPGSNPGSPATYNDIEILPIILISTDQVAEVAELVDAPDLGSGAARCESSSLSFRTIFIVKPSFMLGFLLSEQTFYSLIKRLPQT